MKNIFNGLVVAFLVSLWISPVQAVIIKIATLSPDGTYWMQKMREGAREVAELTDRRVRFKFYPGGVMGDDKAVIRKIRIGQLQGGAVVAGSLSQIFPDIQIYSIPMIFRSLEEVDHVRASIDPLLHDGLNRQRFVVLGIAGGGFAYIMSTKPVRTLNDLHKQKVWVPDNDPMAITVVKNFGVTPIPLSLADVRTGLQTGLIDTIAAPLIGAIQMQWHTQLQYLTDFPLMYIYALLAVDQKIFKRIASEDQKIVYQVMGRVFKDIEAKNRQDNLDGLTVLRNQGIQFLTPSSAALSGWQSASQKTSQLLIRDGKLSHSMVDLLKQHLAEYRTP